MPFINPKNLGSIPKSSIPTVVPVDLRPGLMSCRDQETEGCCSGFTGSFLGEFRKKSSVYFSPAYLYWRTRLADGTFPADSGATVAGEINTLINYGVCLETDLPYRADPTEAGTPANDTSAADNRANVPYFVGPNLSAIQSCLALGYPVGIGMPVYESFESIGSDGKMPIPSATEQLLGGHAMPVVGCEIIPGYITLRNSWGPTWGDGGYVHVPNAYVSRFYEAWSVM